MTSTQDASMDAGQTVSSEAKAAVTADNLDMELEDPYADYEYNPESPLRITTRILITMKIPFQLSK